MKQDADVLVVGGGLAGATTALHMARAGLSVQIFDGKRFPREKPCGEGLMPHGVRLLDELGVLARLGPEDTHHFRGIEYVVDGDIRARGEFPTLAGGYQLGMGVRRLKLDETILSMARAHPNIQVHEEARVDGVILAEGRAIGLKTRMGEVYGRLIVGADGRGSLVRRQVGLDAPGAKRQRWGIRAHYYFPDAARVGEFVEVYKNRFGELYTTPVGPHELLVALLIEKEDMKRFGGKLEQGYFEYIATFPHLQKRLEGAQPCSDVMACGPLACASKRPYGPGVMLVGDAAGFLDAITGEGMTLALSCAKAASQVAVTALAQGEATEAALAPYGPARDRITRHYYIMTHSLLMLSKYHGLARFVVARMGKAPGLFRQLLGLNCGHFRAREIVWGDLGRFLVGV